MKVFDQKTLMRPYTGENSANAPESRPEERWSRPRRDRRRSCRRPGRVRPAERIARN